MAEYDSHLDERLRDVPLPHGLEQRSTAGTVFADAVIDQALSAVVVPVGLLERLRTAVDSGTENRKDGRIDLEQIAAKARREPLRGANEVALRRWLTSLARDGAAVAVALSVAWLLFAGGAEFSRRLGGPPTDSPLGTDSTPTVSRRFPERRADAPNGRAPASPVEERDDLAMALPDTEESWPAATDVATDGDPDAANAAPDAGRPITVRGAAVDLPESVLGGVASVASPRVAWRKVPRVRGFDLAFEMANGESPFVDPSSPGLAADTPPLTVATDSFDRVLQKRDRRERIQPRDLRVEHVLAAMPAPGTGAASDGVRLDVFGVRSLRNVGGAPTVLVEVSATAVGPRVDHAPRESTIVLDRSAGGDPLLWTWLCRGLADIGRRMGPHDRLSVVIAGQLPRLAIRRGAGAEIAELADELGDLPAANGADLDAAIRLAEHESAPAGGRLVVVAHEATAEGGRDVVRTALAAWHAFLASAADDEAGQAGVPRFVLVEPYAARTADGAEPPFGRTVADGMAIRRKMMRQVLGDDTLVAHRCRLTVSFDPRYVAAYRLVGHRQSAMESLASSQPTPLDLHVGETTRVVYEIVPRGRPDPSAVIAELEWQAAGNEAGRKLRRDLSLDSAASVAQLPSPHGCELVLAVAVAETLADSAHADVRVAREAARLIDRWRSRGDVTDFGEQLAAIAGRPIPERRAPR
jgi:hypothetical protein